MIDIARLRSETKLREVEWLDQTDSTNTLALNRINDSTVVTPFLIGAERQTGGRGRGANVWWSADGSLMFSIGVEMPSLGLSTANWPRFSLITGLAIADTIATVLPLARVGLKWPNDVWLDGRKVCGILIEQGDRTSDRLVVGIGLNVNNSFQTAPDEQGRTATSMIDAAQGQSFSRTDVLIAFLSQWFSLVDQLSKESVNLVERWSHQCVLSGRPVTLTSGSSQTTGICAGIDEDGCLLLRTAYAIERCYAGTVRLLD